MRDRGDLTSRVDLTPMIDVVFLLLVFFLTTVRFRTFEGLLETRLPKDVGPAAADPAEMLEPLDIRVERDPAAADGVRVRAARRALASVDALAPLVAGLVARQPDLRARIETGAGVRHGEVVRVVDACLQGGLADLTFALPGP